MSIGVRLNFKISKLGYCYPASHFSLSLYFFFLLLDKCVCITLQTLTKFKATKNRKCSRFYDLPLCVS